jgi:hypothetical protein
MNCPICDQAVVMDNKICRHAPYYFERVGDSMWIRYHLENSSGIVQFQMLTSYSFDSEPKRINTYATQIDVLHAGRTLYHDKKFYTPKEAYILLNRVVRLQGFI